MAKEKKNKDSWRDVVLGLLDILKILAPKLSKQQRFNLSSDILMIILCVTLSFNVNIPSQYIGWLIFACVCYIAFCFVISMIKLK
jgi:ABC-type polysaccharide/polyol phosphate export permease